MQGQYPQTTTDLGRKTIFVSHAQEDRALAAVLCNVIRSAFSHTVRPFSTSDVRPTAGLKPGEAWFARIHEVLSRSHSVWALVTADSIVNSWIYWEAGIGSVLCPGGVAVVLVGLEATDVPGPLNMLEAFDALGPPGDGIDVLLNKAGAQFGMRLHEKLVLECFNEWQDAVKPYRPLTLAQDSRATAPLTPSQTTTNGNATDRLSNSGGYPVATEHDSALIGFPGKVFLDPNTFVRALDTAPDECEFRFLRIDSAGAFVQVSRGGRSIELRLLPAGIEHLAQSSRRDNRRSTELIEQILAAAASIR